MEHLLLPPDSTVIKIPIVSVEDYDGGDFASYPARKGWNVSSWQSRKLVNRALDAFNLTDGHTLNETLAFIQTWLCSGLVRSCLGREVETDDFTEVAGDGRKCWTNRILESHLQRWKDDFNELDQDSRDEAFVLTLDTINIATSAASVLDSYARQQTALYRSDLDGLHQQVFLVMMLQDALCSALRKIHRPGVWHGQNDRSPSEGSMPYWLEHQFELANWCPYTVRNIKLHYDTGVQAYAFALGTVRSERDHRKCTALRCVANQLQINGEAKHRKSGCTCERVQIDVSAVARILENGQIPVFTIEHTPSNRQAVQLCVMPLEPGYPYLTVSHVWADGLASPLANELPTCQLRYLRRVADRLAPRYEPPAHVATRFVHAMGDGSRWGKTHALWFDGLCIPVDSKYHTLRDFSIFKMREIYENASGVIVLDPDLQRLSTDTPHHEVFMRLLISGWSSRLWTFQEGALTFDTFPVGDECVWNLGNMRRNKAGQQNEPLSITLEQALRSRLLRDIILSPGTLKTNPERAHERLMVAVSGRSTSRQGDETVVLASFLGLDTTKLTNLQDPDQRMIALMQMLPSIPSNIIFASGPRLSIKDSPSDWGWVPKTLLAPYGVGVFIIGDGDDIPLHLARSNELSRRPSNYVHPGAEHGLAALFPGIIIITPTNKNAWFPITITTPTGRFQVTEADEFNRVYSWAFRHPKLQAALILSSFDPLMMREEPALLVYFVPSSLIRTDSGIHGLPADSDFRRVFVGGMVHVTGEQQKAAFGVKPSPLPAGTKNPGRFSSEFEGDVMNPMWWLINACSADYMVEERRWLTSLEGT